jgi:hypothetical protein
VTQQYTLSTLWKEGPVPWASGTRNLFIAITPDSITGRSVRAQSQTEGRLNDRASIDPALPMPASRSVTAHPLPS